MNTGADERGAFMKTATPLTGHVVVCPYCATQYSVFASSWCAHEMDPSKICPQCGRCMCHHSVYQERIFWKCVFRLYA